MVWEKLRKVKPLIHDVNDWHGRPDPRFHGQTTDIPQYIKKVGNLKGDMALLERYTHGDLQSVGWDKVCGQCVYFYRDPNLTNQKHGRCRAYGFKEVHEELTAEVKQNYTEPDGQITFGLWPGCPTWTSRERLSKR